MSDELKNAVAARLEEAGLVPTPAALGAGLERNFITDILNGKKKNVRGDNLAKLARALNWTPAELLAAIAKGGEVGTSEASARPPQSAPKALWQPVPDALPQLVPAPVVGVARAGMFEPVDELASQEMQWVNVPRDEDFPQARQMIFDVEGDSMNALAPMPILDGSRVVCVDFEDLQGRVPLQDGMIVVIEQQIADGAVREWSVKEVEIKDDRVEFHPRSTNPKHKPIIIDTDLDPSDTRQVRVLAIVRSLLNTVALSRTRRSPKR